MLKRSLWFIALGITISHAGLVPADVVANDPMIDLSICNNFLSECLHKIPKIDDPKKREYMLQKMEILSKDIETTANGLVPWFNQNKSAMPEDALAILSKCVVAFETQNAGMKIAAIMKDRTVAPEIRYQKISELVSSILPNSADLKVYRRHYKVEEKMSDKPWPGNKAYDEEMHKKLHPLKEQNSIPH